MVFSSNIFPAWLENVKQQAIERGVDLDEILRLNAIYAMEVDKKTNNNFRMSLNALKTRQNGLKTLSIKPRRRI